MAASVSGITQISALPNTGWVAAAVGNGTLAFPLVNQSSTKLDASLFGQKIENAGTSLAIGDIYTAYRMYATATNGVDISADNAALQFHIQDTAGGITAMNDAADVIRVGIFTGGSTANWAEWNVQGRTIFRTGVYVPVICGHRTPDSTGGTLDYTDVTGIYVGFKSAVSGFQYGLSLAVSQLVYWTGPVTFSDTNTDATAPADFLAIINRFSGNSYHGEYVRQAGSAIEFSFPIKNTARNFSTTADISFRTDDCAFTSARDGFYSYEAEPISTGTQTYTATKFSSDATKAVFDLTLDGATGGGTINYTGASVAASRNVVINGTLTTVDGTFSDPVGIDISQSDLDITITKSTNTAPIQWTADLTAGSSITTNRDIDITFAETDLTDIGLTLTASNTVAVNPTTGSGTYTLAGLTTTGTVTLDNDTANNTTVVLPAGTSNATVGPPTTGGGTIAVDSPAVVFTFGSDTASTLIRYFEDGLQTIVDSATGTTLAYEFPDADPVDVEFVKQGYVPLNRQDIVPSDGGTLDAIMDFDEAYNSAHGLTITTEYDYVRATKVLTINSDQNALDVRSSLADVIRTNSSYYNTKLLMEAIPGLTRVDLIDGATITSMATWKGAGMEMFDAADALNPVEKWFSIKSVGTITGATTRYRQTSSGDSTAATLTNNVVDEAFQYWADADHDGTPSYDYSGYMVIKTFLAGAKQGRVDVVANSGLAALKSNLYTVPLANEAHDYAGTDPGISADITVIAGGTFGGKVFAYEIIDGGTNTGANIADQLHYNALTDPNAIVAGGTGLRYFELPNMVIHNATAVETERGYREGATPTLVGFYVSRSSADHPDFTRFQADDGTYYTPAVVNQATITNLPTAGANIRLQIYNITTVTEIYSGDPGAATYSDTYTEGTDYTSGDEIRVRFAELNGATSFKSFETTVTAGATGWSLNAANFLETDAVYATNAVDGSAVTKFNYSAVDDQFNLAVAANFIAAELFAFYCYTLTTSTGIEGAFGAFVAENAGNYKNVTAIASIYLDNETTASQRQTDSARIYRDDSVYPVLDPTTSGFGIDVNWQNVVYVVSTGGSALTAPQAAQLSTIESKTLGLTYTVSNKIDANIHYVNDIEVDGVGSAGNPWGPV